MIVWRGLGILALVFLFLPPGLLAWNMQLWPHDTLAQWEEAMVLTLGWLIGGASCVHLGRRARARGVTHDLYFIRLEYWGFFLWALAVLSLVGLPLGLYEPPKVH